MEQTEQQRWDELYSVYEGLPDDTRTVVRDVFNVEYHKGSHHLLPELSKQILVLELGLMAAGKVVSYAMDGAQEYEDTLAGNEIFEGLSREG